MNVASGAYAAKPPAPKPPVLKPIGGPLAPANPSNVESILSCWQKSEHYQLDVQRITSEEGVIVIREKNVGEGSYWENRQKTMFQREVGLLSSLSHLNVIRVLDKYESHPRGGRLTQVLKMEDGGVDLFELHITSQKGPVQTPTTECVIDYGCQVAEGLAYLKTQKVLHRDIKSENLLLKDGVIKLCDFGFALRLTDGGPLPTDMCGSYRYMSRETRNRCEQSYPADIYALGATLHELLGLAGLVLRVSPTRNEHGFEKLCLVAPPGSDERLVKVVSVLKAMECDEPQQRIIPEKVSAELRALQSSRVEGSS